jgi:anti-sigma B factor antagonist
MSLESIAHHPKEGVTLVELRGRLVHGDELQSLKSQLISPLQKPGHILILNLTNIQFCDSAGLGALLYLDGAAKDAGSTLRLAGVSERLAEVLKMTHTEKFLTVDADVASSLRQAGA